MNNLPSFLTESMLLELFPKIIVRDLLTIDFGTKPELESLYIHGDIGNGKTLQAAWMMASNITKPSDIKKNLFISTSEFLFQIKNSYSNKQEINESVILNRYSDVPILVLDDIAVEKVTDWSYQLLYLLINRRYENLRTTIITSNLNLKELGVKLGDMRIPSRIQGMCKIVKFQGKDYRAKN